MFGHYNHWAAGGSMESSQHNRHMRIQAMNNILWADQTLMLARGGKGGAVVRALASHQCGPGSNPGVDAICGLRLLLVLSFAPRGFSPGTPVFPSPQKPTLTNSNSIWNAWTRLNEFVWTLKCFVGKIAIYNLQFKLASKPSKSSSWHHSLLTD